MRFAAFAIVLGCSRPAPIATPSNATGVAAPGTSTTMVGVLSELVSLAGTVPTSSELQARFARRATAIADGNENADMPPWAHSTHGPSDTFLSMSGGDVAGIRLWEDSRGWGTSVAVTVNRGTFAEAESVVGPTHRPRRFGREYGDGTEMLTSIERAGRTMNVNLQLDAEDKTRVRVVAFFFNNDFDSP